jgi:hypothetical protein
MNHNIILNRTSESCYTMHHYHRKTMAVAYLFLRRKGELDMHLDVTMYHGVSHRYIQEMFLRFGNRQTSMLSQPRKYRARRLSSCARVVVISDRATPSG